MANREATSQNDFTALSITNTFVLNNHPFGYGFTTYLWFDGDYCLLLIKLGDTLSNLVINLVRNLKLMIGDV